MYCDWTKVMGHGRVSTQYNEDNELLIDIEAVEPPILPPDRELQGTTVEVIPIDGKIEFTPKVGHAVRKLTDHYNPEATALAARVPCSTRSLVASDNQTGREEAVSILTGDNTTSVLIDQYHQDFVIVVSSPKMRTVEME
jgi:hypothetical protein